MCAYLLRHRGLDVNAVDKNGATGFPLSFLHQKALFFFFFFFFLISFFAALHWAAMRGSEKCISALIENGILPPIVHSVI